MAHSQKTGKGHGTDIAVMMGLSGENPETIEVNSISAKINAINSAKKILLNHIAYIDFTSSENIHFLFSEALPFHPNGISFLCDLKNGIQFSETYYSIGGGFIVKENEPSNTAAVELPFPINTANELLHWCMKTGLSIAEVVFLKMNTPGAVKNETKQGILKIWNVMRECIFSRLQCKRRIARRLACKAKSF